jgi:hypothetical protein
MRISPASFAATASTNDAAAPWKRPDRITGGAPSSSVGSVAERKDARRIRVPIALWSLAIRVARFSEPAACVST